MAPAPPKAGPADSMGWLRKAQERTWRRQQDMMFHGASPPAPGEQHALETNYQELCARRNINPVPEVRFTLFGENAHAISAYNAIVIDAPLLKILPTPSSRMAMMAHETAHLLLGNDLEKTKEGERAADRLAVIILGDKEPLKEVVRLIDAHKKRQMEDIGTYIPESIRGGERKRLERRLIHMKDDVIRQEARVEKQFGTLAERLAFIDSCDPNDTQLLTNALAQHKQRQAARGV